MLIILADILIFHESKKLAVLEFLFSIAQKEIFL